MGTFRVAARATVTRGANCGNPAASVLFFEHPDMASKAASAAIAPIVLLHFIQSLRLASELVIATDASLPYSVNDLVCLVRMG